MGAGGDFAFGIRIGALDAAAAAGEDAGQHYHFPYARRLVLQWRKDQSGTWVPDQDDQRRWEVVCHECGDTDGPAETQTESVQQLRGPYASEHKAKHAATKHFDEQ